MYLRFVARQKSDGSGVFQDLVSVPKCCAIYDLKVIVDEERSEFASGAKVQQTQLQANDVPSLQFLSVLFF